MTYYGSVGNSNLCVRGETSTGQNQVNADGFYNVVETDGTEVSYTVSAGNLVRVDPSGWAFASSGYIRVTSDSSEAADRNITLLFRAS